MTNKISLGLSIALFLLGSLLFNLNVSAANEELVTAYIRPDGSIEPSTVPIHRNGDFYMFTSNLTAAFVIQKNGVVIDGNGFSLIGNYTRSRPKNAAVYLEGLTNVTIKNLSIDDFRYGIYLENSSFNTIENNVLSRHGDGIVLDHGCINNSILRNNLSSISANSFFLGESSNNIVAYNKVAGSGNILDSYDASNNQILNNQLSTSRPMVSRGVCIGGGSNNNIIRGNEGSYLIRVYGRYNIVLENSAVGIYIGSWAGADGSYNNITQNYIEARVEDKFLPLMDYSAVYVGNGGHNTISKNSIITRTVGIGITVSGGAGENTISENVIRAPNVSGIILNGNGQSVIGNKITESMRGVYISNVSGCLVTQNFIADNQYGVVLLGSSENVISGNKIASNRYGIYSENGTYNGEYVPVMGNEITGNVLSKNTEAAIYLNSSSQSNFICLNNVISNKVGIGFGANSSGNTIYNNNFIDNEVQAVAFPSKENWNSTYSSGGNYWSDYIGKDADGNGVGDTPLVIDADNVDYHPQVAPIRIPELDIPLEPSEPESIQIDWTMVTILVIMAFVGISLLVYFKKRKR
jgi:parallel beta-helix repeat protein